MRRLLILLFALGLIGGGVGVTVSNFSNEATNSGNSFEAASSFGGDLRMAAGSYSGNGSDNRSIDVGFQPDVVIVKASTAVTGTMRTSTMSGDIAKPLTGATALTANTIQSLTANGFTIGTNAQVNTSGTTYYWQAFKAQSGVLKAGSYTGDGQATKAVTGAGLAPEYVAVLPATAQRANQRFSGMTRGFQFDADTGTTTRVTSLDADGFTVANSAEVNTNGTTYHYVAFNETSGTIKKGSYTGTGSSQNVTGVGFSPLYVMLRANDTTTGRQGNHRSSVLTGSDSLLYGASANITTGITSLQADGFGVGTNAAANASGQTYHYLAFKNTGGGCSTPRSQTVAVSADSWVDQSSPTSNKGTDSILKVTSKSSSLNTRALVQANLPTLPSGCNVTSAKLRIYNSSPVSGRTLQAIQNAGSWTENGVTWNNQPSTTGTAATASTPSSAGWMEWTVTSQVQAMYSGSNHGLSVRDASENGAGVEQSLSSREAGSNAPELVVTYG